VGLGGFLLNRYFIDGGACGAFSMWVLAPAVLFFNHRGHKDFFTEGTELLLRFFVGFVFLLRDL